MSDVVVTERMGHVLLIGLNRPDKLNAVDAEVIRQLSAAYTELANDRELRCGVVWAEGRYFTSGLDLGSLAKSMPAEILSTVGEALFVQSITGVHSGVNPVSGDFSVGAEGLMVRGGVLAEPVREVTIASTLQRMLQSVLHIGSDVEWLPGVAAGQTLAIDGMALSGS